MLAGLRVLPSSVTAMVVVVVVDVFCPSFISRVSLIVPACALVVVVVVGVVVALGETTDLFVRESHVIGSVDVGR